MIGDTGQQIPVEDVQGNAGMGVTEPGLFGNVLALRKGRAQEENECVN